MNYMQNLMQLRGFKTATKRPGSFYVEIHYNAAVHLLPLGTSSGRRNRAETRSPGPSCRGKRRYLMGYLRQIPQESLAMAASLEAEPCPDQEPPSHLPRRCRIPGHEQRTSA